MISPQSSHSRHVVLVIDDDANVCLVLQKLLSSENLDVQLASSGENALALLADWLPCLVLVDVMMPGMSGLALCRHLREDPRTSGLSVILMSGRTLLEDIEAGLAAGAADYLKKPFDSDEARLRVSAQIRLHEMHVEHQQTLERLTRSEALYHSLVEYLPQNVFRKDLQGRFTFVNERFCATTGRKAHEILGRTDFDFYPPDLAAKYRDDDSRIVDSGEMVEIVEEHQVPGGARMFVRVIKSPLRDARGEVFGLQAIFWDVTASALAEQELRESEARFRSLTDAAQDAIIMMDSEGRISIWNMAAEKMFGYPQIEALSQPLHELIAPINYLPAITEAYEKFQATGEGAAIGKTVELQARKKDGSLFPVELTLSGVSMHGEWHATGIVRDLTQRRQAEHDRAMMEVQLREAHKLEAVGQLAAGIAHEINTPTQYIGDNTRFLQDAFGELEKVLKGYGRLLTACHQGSATPSLIEQIDETVRASETDYLISEIPRAISQSLEGIARVSMIVGAMKEFSHPSGDEKQAVDLNRSIESTIIVSRNEWKYVAEMKTELDPQLPPVPCLPGEINQVVLNLIVNAAHAIGEVVGQSGQEKGTITIRTRWDGPWAVVEVSDTGKGIPPDIQARVFEPFYTTKEVGKGTGQGLAISRSVVVEKHGGTITFESEVGRGTTFTVRLPLELPESS